MFRFSIARILIFFIFSAFTTFPVMAAPSIMPDFSLESVVDGTTIKSADLKGKTVLVNFWATWCPPCRKEIPSLIKVQDEFAGKEFAVIGISMDKGGKALVERLVKKTGINYPVLMADNAVADDFGGVFGIPSSFIFNQNGELIDTIPGYMSHDDLVSKIGDIVQ